MDAFTFAWATEEPPPERAFKGGKPVAKAVEHPAKFGTFTETERRRGIVRRWLAHLRKREKK